MPAAAKPDLWFLPLRAEEWDEVLTAIAFQTGTDLSGPSSERARQRLPPRSRLDAESEGPNKLESVMRAQLLLWSVLGWWVALSAGTVQAEAPSRTVVFVIDCSKSMGSELGTPAGVRPAAVSSVTRLDAAISAVNAALSRMAGDPSSQCAVWLFGHRLAWDEGDQPELLEQAAYLDATLGYGVLKDLLPGDDVEQVLPLAPVTTARLAKLAPKLAAVKAWGESPLYLAMLRALDSISAGASPLTTELIVITDGGNHQYLAKHKTQETDVLEMLHRRGASVHIVTVGSDVANDARALVEFAAITDASHGRLLHAETAAQLSSHVISLATGERSSSKRSGLGRLASLGRRQEGDDGDDGDGDGDDEVETVDVPGVVRYNGDPVPGAEVKIEGRGPVKTDAAGKFTLKEVVPGTYTFKAQGIHKNVIRKASVTITIKPGKKQPLVEIELEE